jgi:site-specific DNA recombinase
LNILPRINICGGLTVLCSEIANFLNPQTVAQDALNGRRRVRSSKIICEEMWPLRGFLECPECGKTLTGSASKGRKEYYYYYHCITSCGYRQKAVDINSAFINELQKYTPNSAVVALFKQVVNDVYKQHQKEDKTDKRQFLKEIEEQNKRLSKARELLLSDAIEPSDYKIIKNQCSEAIQQLEVKLIAVSKAVVDIADTLEKACSALTELDKLYENGTIQQ